jgi:hypothetical protein
LGLDEQFEAPQRGYVWLRGANISVFPNLVTGAFWRLDVGLSHLLNVARRKSYLDFRVLRLVRSELVNAL